MDVAGCCNVVVCLVGLVLFCGHGWRVMPAVVVLAEEVMLGRCSLLTGRAQRGGVAPVLLDFALKLLTALHQCMAPRTSITNALSAALTDAVGF